MKSYPYLVKTTILLHTMYSTNIYNDPSIASYINKSDVICDNLVHQYDIISLVVLHELAG